MWGGATFDTSMRFLKESPWQRLEQLREQIPNILFQMLLRASSAMGYANYPDNVVRECVREAAAAGIDVFRIFDALNWTPNMRVAMEAVQQDRRDLRGGHLLHGRHPQSAAAEVQPQVLRRSSPRSWRRWAPTSWPSRTWPACASRTRRPVLVKTLRDETGLPIHFHTHDTGGVQAAAILNAAEAGLDIADGAHRLDVGRHVAAEPEHAGRRPAQSRRATASLDGAALDAISEYWREAREFYTAVRKPRARRRLGPLPARDAGRAVHESVPAGPGARACRRAGRKSAGSTPTSTNCFGDIVKVTPTSKAVGDMALFLVANDLTCADAHARAIASWPSRGRCSICWAAAWARSTAAFPRDVRDRILRGEKPLEGRPGESIPPADLAARDATRSPR